MSAFWGKDQLSLPFTISPPQSLSLFLFQSILRHNIFGDSFGDCPIVCLLTRTLRKFFIGSCSRENV